MDGWTESGWGLGICVMLELGVRAVVLFTLWLFAVLNSSISSGLVG